MKIHSNLHINGTNYRLLHHVRDGRPSYVGVLSKVTDASGRPIPQGSGSTLVFRTTLKTWRGILEIAGFSKEVYGSSLFQEERRFSDAGPRWDSEANVAALSSESVSPCACLGDPF